MGSQEQPLASLSLTHVHYVRVHFAPHEMDLIAVLMRYNYRIPATPSP